MSSAIAFTFGSWEFLAEYCRDAVCCYADLAVEEGLVVVGVEPRERPGMKVS